MGVALGLVLGLALGLGVGVAVGEGAGVGVPRTTAAGITTPFPPPPQPERLQRGRAAIPTIHAMEVQFRLLKFIIFFPISGTLSFSFLTPLTQFLETKIESEGTEV